MVKEQSGQQILHGEVTTIGTFFCDPLWTKVQESTSFLAI